jgi:hypothetical protein
MEKIMYRSIIPLPSHLISDLNDQPIFRKTPKNFPSTHMHERLGTSLTYLWQYARFQH